MRDMLKAFLLLIFVQQSLQSFCGSSGVPFSFEVLPSGAPVLGCAQPSCVAGPDSVNEDSIFVRDIDGQSDGFFREGDRELKRYRDQSAPKLIANCSGNFADLSCPHEDQWVGGIEYIDHPRQPLILQCCTFDGLRFSQDVGVTNVGPGEAITGGEVIRDGRQISFDVIANVRKVMDANTHEISYEVTVRRMNCLPDPPEPEVPFDAGVSAEVVKILTKATNGASLGVDSNEEKKDRLKDLNEDRAFAVLTHKFNEKKHKKNPHGVDKSESGNAETDTRPKGDIAKEMPDTEQTAVKKELPSSAASEKSSTQVEPSAVTNESAGSVEAFAVTEKVPANVDSALHRLTSMGIALPGTIHIGNIGDGQSAEITGFKQSARFQPPNAPMSLFNVAIRPSQGATNLPQPNFGSGFPFNQPAQPNFWPQNQAFGGQYGEQQQQQLPYPNEQLQVRPVSGAPETVLRNVQNETIPEINSDKKKGIRISPIRNDHTNQDNREAVQQPGQLSSALPQSLFQRPQPPNQPFANFNQFFAQQPFARTTVFSQQFPFLSPQQPASSLQQNAFQNVPPQYQPQSFNGGVFPPQPSQPNSSPLIFGAPLAGINPGFAQPNFTPTASLARANVNAQQAAVNPAQATALLGNNGSPANVVSSATPQPQHPTLFPTIPPPTFATLPSFDQVMALFRRQSNVTFAPLPTLPTLPPIFPAFHLGTPAPLQPIVAPSIPNSVSTAQNGSSDQQTKLQKNAIKA